MKNDRSENDALKSLLREERNFNTSRFCCILIIIKTVVMEKNLFAKFCTYKFSILVQI